ncbi:MAG: hypothetical protein AB4372_14265 [Xenococcus sp. (in: cyanobacteria)]
MNSLQIQITELEEKIDNLRKLVERIGEQVNILVKDKSTTSSAYSLSASYARNNSAAKESDNAYSLTHHKDIIMDDTSDTGINSASNDSELSTEIQIRRLTAQLTAAYNRIAALEEQLLTYRIPS